MTTDWAAEHVTDDDASPFDRAMRAVQGEQARAVLAALPVRQREVVVLAYWGGYSQQEITSITGAPLGTVKTRSRAALLRLSADLETR